MYGGGAGCAVHMSDWYIWFNLCSACRSAHCVFILAHNCGHTAYRRPPAAILGAYSEPVTALCCSHRISARQPLTEHDTPNTIAVTGSNAPSIAAGVAPIRCMAAVVHKNETQWALQQALQD